MDLCKHFNVEPTKLDTEDPDRTTLETLVENSCNNTGNGQAKETAKGRHDTITVGKLLHVMDFVFGV